MPPKKVNKNQIVCPNPLFLMWLEEWKKEAEERDLNSKWTYGKAIVSIKRYPLPLRSGQEAKILENVGDGIAKRLDQRLNQYLEDGGDPVYLHKIDPVLETNHKEKENRRQYVCKYRSGPYALILTLYQESQKPDYIGFMTKNDLQNKAKPLCDKSFTVPDGGCHYTAWSSMGNLTKKGYITKRSSPAQYSITDSGCELALRLLQGTHELSDNTMNNIRQPTGKGPHKQNDDINKTTKSNVKSSSSIVEVTNLLAQIRKDKYKMPKKAGKSISPSSTITKSTKGLKSVNDKKSTKSYMKGMDSPVIIDEMEMDAPTLPELIVPSSSATNRSKGSLANIDKPTTETYATNQSSRTMATESDTDYLFDSHTTSATTNDNTLSQGLTKKLHYWYVTDTGTVTILKSRALVSIDASLGVGFLIKVDKGDLENSTMPYKIEETRKPVDGYVYAYLSDEHTIEIADPPQTKTCSPSSARSSDILKSLVTPSIVKPFELEDSLAVEDIDMIFDLQVNHTKKKYQPATLSSSTTSLKTSLSTSSVISVKNTNSKGPKKILDANSTIEISENSTKRIPTKESKSSSKDRIPETVKSTKLGTKNPVLSTDAGDDTIAQITSTKRLNESSIEGSKIKTSKPNPAESLLPSIDVNMSDMTPLFILYPGSFDIVLCVDIIETSGPGRRKKDLAEKLSSSGIDVDVRKLQLGDFLWVAKEKGGNKRELVLDFIIERKRMDDLAGSIVDGRFREQKFRLRGCGLRKPIYLVEKYGSVDHYPVPISTLQQAITNTQVIDGFFVKETMDIYDSANYLTLMTAQLSSLYSDKILHALSFDTVKEYKMNKDHEDLVQENIQYFSTFDEFSLQTMKSKMLSVRELFAKQLMMIKGLTTEKALAILEHFPTPLHLVNMYNSLTSVHEKENLLEDIQHGKSKRKIGSMISSQVYIMYSAEK